MKPYLYMILLTLIVLALVIYGPLWVTGLPTIVYGLWGIWLGVMWVVGMGYILTHHTNLYKY